MVTALASLADALGLLLGIVRVRCTWEAGLDLCHPPQTTRYAPMRMAHAIQPESHTSAPTSATAVNHLAETLSSKRVLIPATLMILIALVKRGSFPSETYNRNKATKSWEMQY